MGGGVFRASNTIKYSNTFGPLHAELDIRLNESDEGKDVAETLRGDGIGLGLSWAVTDNITIAAAWDSEDGAERLTAGVAPFEGSAPTTGQFNLALADWDDNPSTVDAAPPSDLQTFYADASGENFRDMSGDGGPTSEQQRIDYIAGLLGNNPGVEADDFGKTGSENHYRPEVNGSLAGSAPDTDRIGVAVKATFGDYWLSVGWQNYDVDDDERTVIDDEVDIDTAFIYGGGSLGERTSWMLGYAEADDGANGVTRVYPEPGTASDGSDHMFGVDASSETDDSEQFVWAIYHNLGGGMKLYYEAVDVDSENKEKDGARHLLGMRVDF